MSTVRAARSILLEDAKLAVETEGISPASAFTKVSLERIVDLGLIQDFEIIEGFDGSWPIAAWSLESEEDHLDLFTLIFGGDSKATVDETALIAAIEAVVNFIEAAPDAPSATVEALSSALFGITEAWTRVHGVRIHVITDGAIDDEVELEDVPIDKLMAQVLVWDADQLAQIGEGRPDSLTIDLEDFGCDPLPCLSAPASDDHQVFLTLIPGIALSRIYQRLGGRVLERNVRSFLQAKGRVNRGIKETILDSPERFLAYNNGISATAASVDLVDLADGTRAIARLTDFQIVNGGQTTASIASAEIRDGAVLDDLTVQAKITVIDSDDVDDFVKRISQYSNTQNKVTGADFSANDPFHVAIEEHSRRMTLPTPENATCGWYFERSRGAYATEASASKDKKEFKARWPAELRFSKTDLAKYEHTWEQLPHFVCLGAEKNYRQFVLRLNDRRLVPDEEFFVRLIAKAILFRSASTIIGDLDLGGFRANVTTYTVAKIVHGTSGRIDLRTIWSNQRISQELAEAIESLAPSVHHVIVAPTGRIKHPGEWSKKIECWESVVDLDWAPSKKLRSELLPLGHQPPPIAPRVPAPADGRGGDLEMVLGVPAETWFAISHWAKVTNNLQPWQRSLAYSLGRCANAGRPPSPKQAKQGAIILTESRRLGFREGAS